MLQQVVLEDGTILSLIGNSDIAQKIPCLANKKNFFAASSNGCGTCARKRMAKNREELAKIKACIVALSTEKRNELKQLLNTQSIKVVYTNASGQTLSAVF